MAGVLFDGLSQGGGSTNAEKKSYFGAVYFNTARLAASMVLEHSTRVSFLSLVFCDKRRRLMGQWWWSVCSSVYGEVYAYIQSSVF
jgi:hypothetical protein